MRRTLFLAVFAWGEAALNVVSGAFAAAAPVAFLGSYAPQLAETAAFADPLTHNFVRTFGMMVVVLGAVQHGAYRLGGATVRAWVLGAMLFGDLLHLVTWWPYQSTVGAWNAAAWFNLGITLFLAATRTGFLLTGVPARGAPGSGQGAP